VTKPGRTVVSVVGARVGGEVTGLHPNKEKIKMIPKIRMILLCISY